MYNILIIGYGVVGKLEHKILEKLNPDIYDINGYSTKKYNKVYDFAIVCVPTPTIDGKCNISEVSKAINEHEANIYIIKSTVAVGVTDKLKKLTGKRLVFSPEHSGATQHCNDFDYNFTILGGDKKDCYAVQQMYQEVFNAYHTFKIVDSQTAELHKYMINSYLGMKVSFCVEYWKICQELGLSYEELRECFVLDPRIEASHTFVYDNHPYWDSHCLNKDIPAIANQFDIELLKEIVKRNEEMKK